MFGNYQRVSKKNGRVFTLTFEQFRFLTSSLCHYCGSPPLCLMMCNKGKANKKSVWGDYSHNGIDRIDNEKGYTPDNCLPCCHFCNRARNSRPYTEFLGHMRGFMERIKAGAFPAAAEVTFPAE